MEKIKSPFLELPREEQKISLEAIIFASEEPLSTQTLFKVLILGDSESKSFNPIITNPAKENEYIKQITLDEEAISKFNFKLSYFDELVYEINKELQDTNRPYYIVNVAGGYSFATRQEYGTLIHQLIKSKSKKRLSQASLETLSVIAYRQPVTKPEIEQIRGVSSGDVINNLIAKNLVKIVGRKDTLGKPLIYGTTTEFLKTFGINSIEDLPKLRELEDFIDENNIESDQFEIVITQEQANELKEFKTDFEPEYFEEDEQEVSKETIESVNDIEAEVEFGF